MKRSLNLRNILWGSLTLLMGLSSFWIGCSPKGEKAPEFNASDNRLIMQVLEKQQDAWNHGDIDAFMIGYWKSDSMQFLGRNGINYGWQRTLESYKKNYPDTTVMGKLTFTILKLNPVSHDAAFLTGTFYLNRTIGDVDGIFTLVFRKINGAWVIVYDHTS